MREGKRKRRRKREERNEITCEVRMSEGNQKAKKNKKTKKK